ncbi:MAG: type IV pilin protein [Pyrinomonadaceae bacterium]|nr:type IV pilin protein [Gammaproteobacteria bacterium]MBA3573025.1 type IV pilin protein [Pyrinomonadaceae bacterium]
MAKIQARGFTLVELMIAVAIVAILAGIAYPSYVNQLQSSRRAEGQALVMEIMAAQERYYSSNNTYTSDLAQLGYTLVSGNLDPDGGWYRITAAACGTAALNACVNLSATGQGAQVDDGTLTLNSRGEKTGHW